MPEKEVLTPGYGRHGQEDPFFHFHESLDEVAVWRYALSTEEVLYLCPEGNNKITGSETVIRETTGSRSMSLLISVLSGCMVNSHTPALLTLVKYFCITTEALVKSQ